MQLDKDHEFFDGVYKVTKNNVVDPRSGTACIHTDLTALDPNPYWECGSGFGSRSMGIDNN